MSLSPALVQSTVTGVGPESGLSYTGPFFTVSMLHRVSIAHFGAVNCNRCGSRVCLLVYILFTMSVFHRVSIASLGASTVTGVVPESGLSSTVHSTVHFITVSVFHHVSIANLGVVKCKRCGTRVRSVLNVSFFFVSVSPSLVQSTVTRVVPESGLSSTVPFFHRVSIANFGAISCNRCDTGDRSVLYCTFFHHVSVPPCRYRQLWCSQL